MHPPLIVFLGALVVCSASCTNPAGANGDRLGPEIPAGPALVEAPPRPRPGFEHAQKLSDQVKAGTPQSTVESMFGPPDKAGFKTYGTAAGTPWRALVWEWVFKDVIPHRVLSIVFQEVRPGEWLVNHGDWP